MCVKKSEELPVDAVKKLVILGQRL